MSKPPASLDRAAYLDEQVSFAFRTAAAAHEEQGNSEAADALREQARYHSLRETRLRALAEVQPTASEDKIM